METWAIIFNPTAGTFRPHKLEEVQRALRDHGVATQLMATNGPGHATELAREVNHVQRVAAFGGDGTLNEVANGLLGRDLPLLFLPGGTANVMAYELGMPTDPVRAAIAGLRARAYPVRPGRVDGRAFLLMAGFGFDGEAVHRVNPRLKWWTGKGAYVWSGLQALTQQYPRMTLAMNGAGTLEGRWVVAARATHYGGAFRIHPDAGLLKDALGLVLVRQGWFVPFLVGHLGLNLHAERKGISLRALTECRLECERPVHVQVDGDYFGSGRSFTLGLADKTVNLLFPWR